MTEVLTTIAQVREARAGLQGSVGFVPTMGFLHDGHMSLVRAAREQNDHVFVSIFVNPTQFAPGEDLATYPRDPERDLELLREAGVDYAFMPAVEEMYPEGFSTKVEVGPVAEPLEGAARPGHFAGVATVVLKLLNIVQPQRVYFGRKDAQQLVVVRRMVQDLDLPVEIVAMPTVREFDGLALSSRNSYLTPEQRKAAPAIYESLQLAQEMWTRGLRDAQHYRRRIAEYIEEKAGVQPEYVSVAHPETLQELERIQGPALVSLAVRIGRARLIDNLTLGE